MGDGDNKNPHSRNEKKKIFKKETFVSYLYSFLKDKRDLEFSRQNHQFKILSQNIKKLKIKFSHFRVKPIQITPNLFVVQKNFLNYL